MTHLMKCGHVAQGEDDIGKPVCVICAGLREGYDVPVMEPPPLTDRKARCGDCNSEVDSKYTLPFFEHNSKKPKDRYYCGCQGWD